MGEALSDLRHQLAELLVHEHAPLALAQQASGVRHGSPLFTSIFNYRHSMHPGTRADQGRESAFEGISTMHIQDATNYPVAVTVDDYGTGFGLTVDAVTPADPEQLCVLLGTALQNLAVALRSTPEAGLGAIGVLDAVERRRVVEEWNDTAAALPEALVPGLIAERAAADPTAVAVVCDGIEVSYADLDERANRLAHLLVGAGVDTGHVVGLCLPRGVDMVTAILGVWKAGVAYLPLDPEYPAERLTFMLADAGVDLLVGAGGTCEGLSSSRTVALDDPAVLAELAAGPATAPDITLTQQQLAYVIYTSGSTGRPKGVQATHGGLVNLAVALG
ncbi:AMP-binding protein, partial [Streptomyces sp. NPDC004542]|uniref:AMP-binding protein n=1 Tax=Streptomyces sp. NPDC004542 TaxID=3154281 RepID=UPI0033AB407F